MNATLSSLQAAVFTPEQAPTIKMPHAAGQATADDPPVLEAAIGLAEQIRAASEEIERGRRLPPSSASASKWCSSSTRRRAARQSIRKDHSIAACATS